MKTKKASPARCLWRWVRWLERRCTRHQRFAYSLGLLRQRINAARNLPDLSSKNAEAARINRRYDALDKLGHLWGFFSSPNHRITQTEK